MATIDTSRFAVRALAGVAIVLLALIGTFGGPAADSNEHYSLSGSDIALYDLAGVARLEPGSGSSVQVQVNRGGADAARLDVRISPIGGRQTLCVRFPSDHVTYPAIGGSRSTVRVRDDGTFGDGGDEGDHRVTISGHGGDFEAWADLAVSVPRGQRLVLHMGVGDIAVSNVDGDLKLESSSGVISTTGTRGKLRADTGSGMVVVHDAQGEVSLDTGSGGVEVSRVKGTELSVDTGSGHVTVDEAKVDHLHVDTGSGSVGVRGLDAPRVELDTGSGGIDVDLGGDVESLTADTGSGHVTLMVPRSLGATFELSSSSGQIEVGVPHESTHLERGEARGRIGDGRGRIRLESGSGSVRIRPRATGGSSLLMVPDPVLRSTLE
jgi:lia operon protein LiaG